MSRWTRNVLAALSIALGVATTAKADERLFTYTYEPKVLPKGAVELEQWATMRNGRDEGIYTRWDLRTEIEVGLTDRLTTAIYANSSNKYEWKPGKAATNGTYFRGISSEWKLKLLDPTADPIGVLLYGEVAVDRREWEAEGKLVVGKNIGPLTVAANAIFEQEWKATLDAAGEIGSETEQIVEGVGGLSYRIGSVAVGAEARSHTVIEGDEKETAVFLGPAVHAAGEKWWATLTVLRQLSDEYGSHERTESRLLIGLHL
ncbi:hypothetical protein FJZ36_06020 [Candidatus Poribacteria bacterium]|nr:hypothetical protein [Candidatus Poribacteria bacterium]